MIDEAYIDGAVAVWRGWPHMGIGIVLGPSIRISESLDFSHSTKKVDNNRAEYAALLFLLNYALRIGRRALKVHSDSEIVVKQIRGEYKCKSNLRGIYSTCRDRVQEFEYFEIVHIPRGKNNDADALAKNALRNRAR